MRVRPGRARRPRQTTEIHVESQTRNRLRPTPQGLESSLQIPSCRTGRVWEAEGQTPHTHRCSYPSPTGQGRPFYQWSRAVQIRTNLDLVLDWLQGAGLGDIATEFFRKLSMAVNLLCVPRTSLLKVTPDP